MVLFYRLHAQCMLYPPERLTMVHLVKSSNMLAPFSSLLENRVIALPVAINPTDARSAVSLASFAHKQLLKKKKCSLLLSVC